MPTNPKLVVHVMGGLGNQMFQYAASRAMAVRSGADLVLDPWTGFVRDRMFKRRYALSAFPIQGRSATRTEGLPFWGERLKIKYRLPPPPTVSQRWWGDYVWEREQKFYDEVASLRTTRSTWLHGHWQSERYFEAIRDRIAVELMPPPSRQENVQAMRTIMAANNAVAIGVRLFEELPESKAGVGGLTPLDFYRRGAEQIAAEVANPVFFVFCSTKPESLLRLDLPGPVHFVTGDDGFHSAIDSLWLLAECKYHVLANSSFFWWGAWLAEQRHRETRIIASDCFPNASTVPTRWKVATT